jgi:hypothetical protein
MNKKKNIIFIICLSMLVSLSIGYAIFNEDIKFDTTARTVGTWDIGLDCVVGFSNVYTNMGYEDSNLNSSNQSCVIENNTISYNATLNYGEAYQYFTVKITNNGSITLLLPKYDNITNYITDGYIYIKDSMGSLDQYIYYNDGAYSTYSNYFFNTFGEPYFQKKDGSLIAMDDVTTSNFIATRSGESFYKLKQGESMHFLIGLMWEHSSSLPSYDYFETSTTLTLPFEQETQDTVYN